MSIFYSVTVDRTCGAALLRAPFKTKLCEENVSVQGKCVAGAFESLCLNFFRGRYTSCLTCTGKSGGTIQQSNASCVAFGGGGGGGILFFTQVASLPSPLT